jgi:hypothetical protein
MAATSVQLPDLVQAIDQENSFGKIDSELK